jgi:hypothetical protein
MRAKPRGNKSCLEVVILVDRDQSGSHLSCDSPQIITKVPVRSQSYKEEKQSKSPSNAKSKRLVSALLPLDIPALVNRRVSPLLSQAILPTQKTVAKAIREYIQQYPSREDA